MINYLEELLRPALIELSSAQRERVLEAAAGLAAERQDEELGAHVSRAIAHESQVRKLESQWQAGSSSRAAYVPEMGPHDLAADRHLTSMRDLVQAQISGVGVPPEMVERGRGLIHEMFPGGDVSTITKQSYIEQHASMQDLVALLQGELAEEATSFGLGPKIAVLATITSQYGAMLERSPAALQASQVQTARDLAEHYFHQVLARVMGLCFNPENPQHAADLHKVMSVLFDEMAQTRGRTKARRASRKRRKQEPGDDPAADDSGTPAADGTPAAS